MNVMRGQIVQVAKWGAWAVLEQRYNTAKYLNRTVGTKSNKISISMHLARKLLLAKMAWKFTFTFEIWSYGKPMLLLYSCRCCAIRKDNIPENDSLPRGSSNKKRSGENLLTEAKKMRLASLTPIGFYSEGKRCLYVVAWGPFPPWDCFARVGRQVASFLQKSVRHGLFL